MSDLYAVAEVQESNLSRVIDVRNVMPPNGFAVTCANRRICSFKITDEIHRDRSIHLTSPRARASIVAASILVQKLIRFGDAAAVDLRRKRRAMSSTTLRYG
jgi:hypothetical protein